MISIANNMSSLPKATKELVTEMYMSITDERYPSYNAAMLLYRPILIHILKDHDVPDDYLSMNYSEIILAIVKYWNFDNDFKNRMFEMKRFVNNINHSCEVVMDKDYDLVIESWNIIKILVEEIY